MMSYRMSMRAAEAIALIKSLPDQLVVCHPALERGQVWCRRCGHTQRVDAAECFRSGWPRCCGRTMTIDPPTPSTQVTKEGM